MNDDAPTGDDYTNLGRHTNSSATISPRPKETAERVAAQHLVALFDERVALTHAFAEHSQPTSSMMQAMFDKGDELTQACEAFRRRFYPRRHRVLVAHREVLLASKTLRSVEVVFDGSHD